MLQTPENSPRPRTRKTSEIARLQADPKARLSQLDLLGSAGGGPGTLTHNDTLSSSPNKDRKDTNKRFMTLGHKTRLKKALQKMNFIPKNLLGYVYS